MESAPQMDKRFKQLELGPWWDLCECKNEKLRSKCLFQIFYCRPKTPAEGCHIPKHKNSTRNRYNIAMFRDQHIRPFVDKVSGIFIICFLFSFDLRRRHCFSSLQHRLAIKFKPLEASSHFSNPSFQHSPFLSIHKRLCLTIMIGPPATQTTNAERHKHVHDHLASSRYS